MAASLDGIDYMKGLNDTDLANCIPENISVKLGAFVASGPQETAAKASRRRGEALCNRA